MILADSRPLPTNSSAETIARLSGDTTPPEGERAEADGLALAEGLKLAKLSQITLGDEQGGVLPLALAEGLAIIVT